MNKWWTPEETRRLVMREMVLLIICVTGVLVYFGAILLSGPADSVMNMVNHSHVSAFSADGAPRIFARQIPGGCLYESRSGLALTQNSCANPEDLNK